MAPTRQMMLDAKKHFVALDPFELGRMTRGNNITLVEISVHDPRRPRRPQQTWIMYSIAFFTACFMYGLGAYSFVRYIFSVLHMADGLVHVDSIMRERYGISAVDWNFFSTVGLVTVCIEMYALILTFLMMIRQYDAIAKFTGKGPWNRLMAALHFLTACGSLILILLFFYFSTGYHFIVIQKVLSLSQNGRIALEIFHNSTASLISQGSGALPFLE